MKRATPCVPKTGHHRYETQTWIYTWCWFRPNTSNINEIKETYLFSSSSFFLGWYFLDRFLCKIQKKKLTCVQYYHTSHTISAEHCTVRTSTRYTTSGNPIYTQYILIYYIINCAVCDRMLIQKYAQIHKYLQHITIKTLPKHCQNTSTGHHKQFIGRNMYHYSEMLWNREPLQRAKAPHSYLKNAALTCI